MRNAKKNQKNKRKNKGEQSNRSFHRSPLSRLRAGGEGCPHIRDRLRLSRLRAPSVSWLGGTASRGLPIPTAWDSGSRGTSPPDSRAAATAFHRLPGTDPAVDVADPCVALPMRAARLRVNNGALRPGLAGTLRAKL